MSTIKNVNFGNYNTIYDYAYLENCSIGNYVYIADRTRIGNAEIGNFCSIGPDVRIGLGIHPTNFMSTFPAFYSIGKQCQITFVEKNHFIENGNIVIGNDVWIGYNATILDNITIGDGAIIGAGALVTKDVAPFSIVGGVPARLIKKRFEQEQIEKLLKLKWWNKNEEWIKIHAPLFIDKELFTNKIL
jgi:acetyltransferase-like isoleucine patch superfamily enzyme